MTLNNQHVIEYWRNKLNEYIQEGRHFSANTILDLLWAEKQAQRREEK